MDEIYKSHQDERQKYKEAVDLCEERIKTEELSNAELNIVIKEKQSQAKQLEEQIYKLQGEVA